MHHSRLRLRSSIILTLMTLICLSVLTLQMLTWSTVGLEPLGRQKPPTAIPFWLALDQPNVYDVKAIQAKEIHSRSSPITSARIDELYQLVRQARLEQINSYDQRQSQSINHSLKTVEQINTTFPSNITMITTTFSKWDKIQLRDFVHHKLIKWKEDHHDDPSISLADIMHDAIVQDEPARLNTTWFEYMKTVTNFRVYNPRDAVFKDLLNHLQNGEVSAASEMSQGTQMKLILNLPNGIQGLLKPYRVPRNYQTQPDHFYFSDVERHHAEIAAFHVDKILGFYRVPPVIGRFLNITRDIHVKATSELAETFFISPANNICFRGHCSDYCDTAHAICGKPGDQLEGSIQILLPRPPEVVWHKMIHPYRRSYSSIKKAPWELNENYCYEQVLIDEDYHNRLLLDMMDLSAFDFLIGNLDRHHIMRISSFGTNTGVIHLDNGRSFGRYDHDDLSILSPIRQCCFFRHSTFIRLYRIYRKGLSKLLVHSLKIHEQLQMILVDEHLQAIDRRLEILFAHLETCFRTYTVEEVMIDDGIG